MGNQVSDLYKVQELNTMQQKDHLPILYIWIDLNIKNEENSIHSKSFKEFLELIEVDSQEKFAKEIDKSSSAHYRIRIICAASLPQEFYRFLQDHDKIERVVLFCRTNARSYTLLKNYGKIKQTCNSPSEVVKAFLSWEKQEEKCVIFFEEESIRCINQYLANLLTLSDRRQILASQAKKVFEAYCYKFIKGQKNKLRADLGEYQRARLNEEELWQFMEKRLAGDSQIIPLVNDLLISTFNTKKLGYLRYLINDIYNPIINNYKHRYNLQSREYYSLLRVNETELQKLRYMKGRYLLFTYFLQASIQKQYEIVMGNDVLITIRIPESTASKYCNGYVINLGKIMFNLGNYFRVEEYKHDEQRLTISLLQFEEQLKIDLSSQSDCIFLNKVYMSNQHARYEGQWHGILLNLSQSISNEYINMKINALMSETPVRKELIFKYQLNNFKQQFNQDIVPEDFQQFLHDLQAQQLQRQEQLAEILCVVCEYYWAYRKKKKVEECMKKLHRLQVFIKKEKVQQRYRLLKYGFNVHCPTTPREFTRIHKNLNQMENDMMRLCQFLAFQNYHLLLRVRIKCFEQANQLDDAIKVLDQLIKIYGICKGRCSHQCGKLLKWKGEMLQRRDSELINQERKKKQRLYTSSVTFSDFKRTPFLQKYPINLGAISLHFYT